MLIHSLSLLGLEVLQALTPQRIYNRNNFPTVCLDYLEVLSSVSTFGAEISSGKVDFFFFFKRVTTEWSVAWGPAYESFGTDKAEFEGLLFETLSQSLHLSQPQFLPL